MRKILIPISILVLTLVIAGAMIALRPEAEKKPAAERRLLVEVAPAELSSLAIQIPSQGTVQPRTETTIVSEVSGKIVQVSENLVAGGFFRKGDNLLEIDPRDYQVAIKQAQARLAQAQAQLAQEQARADQAIKDWTQLGRTGQPNDLVLRRPQVAEASANVSAAEADLLRAERDLDKTKIRAPYDGLVKSKDADVGRYVTPGTPVAATFAVDLIEIRLPLSDADLAFLELPRFASKKAGPEVLLTAVVSGRERQWLAQIVRTEGIVDERNRVTYAVAQLTDPYNTREGADAQRADLPIGTFVRADIAGIWANDVVTLPRHALRDDNSVLLAATENELEIRQVQVLRADQQHAYISAGLQPGDRVITTAINVPIPGTKLSVRDQQDQLDSTPEFEPDDLIQTEPDDSLAEG